jgi:hypothetical protein
MRNVNERGVREARFRSLALLLLILFGIGAAVAWLIFYSGPTTKTRSATQAPAANESRPVTVIAGGEIRSVYPSFEPRQVDVMDGDTIRADGRVYRLVGFDTPENGSNAKCQSERALAERARSRLGQIVAKRRGLRLQRVACACRAGTEGTQTCNHGRLCGVLTAAGRDVGGPGTWSRLVRVERGFRRARGRRISGPRPRCCRRRGRTRSRDRWSRALSGTRSAVRPPALLYCSFTTPKWRLNFVAFVSFCVAELIQDNKVRELNCFVRPDPQGWCVIIRNCLHGRFHTKDDALRSAISEARKARAAGFYTTVKIQHEPP